MTQAGHSVHLHRHQATARGRNSAFRTRWIRRLATAWVSVRPRQRLRRMRSGRAGCHSRVLGSGRGGRGQDGRGKSRKLLNATLADGAPLPATPKTIVLPQEK
nr:uncharacterized protein LOC123286698 [Equus asinus]